MKQRSIFANRLRIETVESLRRARIRSIYFEWCGIYNKHVDETRFPTFASNFMTMEAYADKNGKSIQLNPWYDCTEEEFNAQNNGGAVNTDNSIQDTEKRGNPREIAKELWNEAEAKLRDAQLRADAGEKLN